MIQKLLSNVILCAGVLLLACACKPELLPDGGARVQVIRVAASETKTVDDIAPYNEALVWHEYEVKKVLRGVLEAPRIRVAHWSVIRGKNVSLSSQTGETLELQIRPLDRDDEDNIKDVVVSDDLDILAEEPPRFMDMANILAKGQTPGAVRYDYDSLFSDQMQLYWHLRHQLELVVLGNSHAAEGIRPELLLGEENKQTPQALNLSPGGAKIDMQCLLAEDYVLPLPKINTLVWMISARVFNEELNNSQTQMDNFKASPGYDYDREHWHELWPVKMDVPPATISQLRELNLSRKKFDLWGWSGHEETVEPDQLPKLTESLNEVEFKFDDDAWKRFEQTVAAATAKGIRVYIVTSPIHPISKDTPAADPDGTSREGEAMMVDLLQKMDAASNLVWFQDVNKGGNHGISADSFYDMDHLNYQGATDLSTKLAEWIKNTQLPPAPR